MDIVKNPVIIGVFAGVVVYIYMSWSLEEKKKKNKNKSQKEEQVNLLVPLAVAVIAWFIAYGYFSHSSTEGQQGGGDSDKDIGMPKLIPKPMPVKGESGYRFTGDVMTSSSSDPRSFSMLPSGGITIPSKFPDVMIELFDD